MKRFTFHGDDTTFDLAIVGGGIYGASMAYTATLNGLSVVLLERDDFASATSAQSQKVIHGGLRYLQSLDIKRVIESIREKQRFYAFFPHMVKPLPCALPTKGYGTKGNEAFRAAFLIYKSIQACICRGRWGAHQDKQPRLLGLEEFRKSFPQVDQDFRGGALWYDGLCVEPERVILSLLHSAALSGAQLGNYCAVQSIETLCDGRIALNVDDLIGKTSGIVYARKVALCTGPYRKESLGMDSLPDRLENLALIRGINLIYPDFIKAETSLGLKGKSGKGSRFFFVVPWKNYSIAGTHWEQVESIQSSQGNELEKTGQEFHCDVQHLFANIPDFPLVLRKHVGYVPGNHLAEEKEDAAGAILPHYMLIDREATAKGRILQVVGVKFTTAFDVTVKALSCLFPKHGIKDSMHFETSPHGCKFVQDPEATLLDYQERFAGTLTKKQIGFLFGILGTELPVLFEQYLQDKQLNTGQLAENELYQKLTSYCVEEEMACSLKDLIDRRLFPNSPEQVSDTILLSIAEQMALLLDWDDNRKLHELEEVKNNLL